MAGPRRNPNPLAGLLFLSAVFFISSATFVPADNHLLFCGSSAAAALPDRRLFLSDNNSGQNRHRISITNPSPATPLAGAARIFTRPASYDFEITRKGLHLIRLHFYSFKNDQFDLSAAKFHVLAADRVLLANFSADDADVIKEYLLPLSEGKFLITFAPAEGSQFAFVNAIEVFSAPEELIRGPARLVGPDGIEKFDNVASQAMETVFRVNVGRELVTPVNDTLWRTWTTDEEFLNNDSSVISKTVRYSSRLKYQKSGASREVAPDYIYDTARIIEDGKANMTWEFAVESGYKYFVRMHFCDIASKALNELYFSVYLNGYVAYEEFDVSSLYNVLAAPLYVDFVVDVQGSERLSVSIVPLKMARDYDVKGLLNGLEILKMNNSIGSLDGDVPIVLVTENPLRRGFGAFLRSIGCGFAFISLAAIAFMLFLRWRSESRALRAWSRLPTDVSDGHFTKERQLVSSKLVSF